MRVRRERVLTALQWLKENNPFYSNITINHNTLGRLPEDGIPPELQTVENNALEEGADDSNDGDDVDPISSHSFLPFRRRAVTLLGQQFVDKMFSTGPPLTINQSMSLKLLVLLLSRFQHCFLMVLGTPLALLDSGRCR